MVHYQQFWEEHRLRAQQDKFDYEDYWQWLVKELKLEVNND